MAEWIELDTEWSIKNHGTQFSLKVDGENKFFKVIDTDGCKVKVELMDSCGWGCFVDMGMFTK